MIKIIKDQTLDQERAFYNLKDTTLVNITFQGEADGESALKEARNCNIKSCLFDLRYPLWHVNKFTLEDSIFTVNSRAPLWYTMNGIIDKCQLSCPKALRECEEINIVNSNISGEEFGWKCNNIKLEKTYVESNYLFFNSNNITLNNVEMKGKYSFQYINNLSINNSNLDTKDAFWHCDNAYIKNTVIKGAYIGWYSKNMRFENCTIISTQPFCYCENLELINCKMIDADLAFEHSTVHATIDGDILSIKNPIDAFIICDNVHELIIEDSLYEPKLEICERNYIYEKLDKC